MNTEHELLQRTREHQRQVMLLENTKKDHTELFESHSRQVSDLQRKQLNLRVKELEHLLQSKLEEIEALSKKNESEVAEYRNAPKNDDLQAKLEQLENELSAKDKETKKLRGQLKLSKNQNSNQLKDVESKLKNQEAELEEYRKKIATLEEGASPTSKAKSASERKTEIQLNEVKRQLQTRDKKLEMLQQEVDKLRAVETISQKLKDELDIREQRVSELEAAVKKAKEEATEDAADKALDPNESEAKIKELRDRVRELEVQVKDTPEASDLKSRLQRQFEAFNTLRSEISTQRERQFDSEAKLEKDKSTLERERVELELTVQRLKDEYETHLEKMWRQYESMREHHEEDLSAGRSALDSAQVKLMMNGYSPVSENGFQWTNTDDEEEEDEGGAVIVKKHVPAVGKLPPLEKPAFAEFLEIPRCGACQSEVIEI
ncbi:unnamed protein product [Mucor hiemalis]